MDFGYNMLFPDERKALIDALRRDTESQREKAERFPRWADYHRYNIRMNIRIIEAFDQRLEPS